MQNASIQEINTDYLNYLVMLQLVRQSKSS
uniref:Uncharacterized protein n=1 Tax=Arundo donax TaxID=35708 RepID=A0A0A9F8I2_ARUDO